MVSARLIRHACFVAARAVLAALLLSIRSVPNEKPNARFGGSSLARAL